MENTATATPSAPKAPVIDPKNPTPPPDPKAGANGGQPAAGAPPASGAAAVKSATDAAMKKYRHVVIDEAGERDVDLADILKDHKEKILEDGQEREVTWDELKKGYQARQVSAKRFEEAARVMKNAQRFIQLLKQDPAQVLPHLGIDPKAWAKQYILKEIELAQMSPEEKKYHDAMEKMKALEDEKKQREEADTAAKEAELRKHFDTEYTKDIIAGLESVGLPRTPATVKRIAYYLHEGLKRGLRLKAAQVAPLVRDDYKREMQELFGALPEKELLNVVGEDFAGKVRKVDLARLDPGAGGNPNPGGPPAPANDGQPKPKMTMEEWRERNRRIMEGKE